MAAINGFYPNYVLSAVIEDQFNSKLDLQNFVTVDRSLEGTAGMKKVINTYSATDGAEVLGIGVGNSKKVVVSHNDEDYTIKLVQDTFQWYDEEEMHDPNVTLTGSQKLGVDLFNKMNDDIYSEYANIGSSMTVTATAGQFFEAFVDAAAKLNMENVEGVEKFAFVSPSDMAAIRKGLKDDLKYVESYSRSGYVGEVAGIKLFVKADATPKTVYMATKEAVTLFVKKGTEVERPSRNSTDADVRLNTLIARKYYVAALTDATKAVKIVLP